MENAYLHYGIYFALAVIAVVAIYHFTVYVLPWLFLVAIVIAAIWFYFWQRSTRRSDHPWNC